MHNHKAGAALISYYGATSPSSGWRHVQVRAKQLLERIHDIGVSLLKGSKEEKEGRAAETVNPLKFFFCFFLEDETTNSVCNNTKVSV